MNTVFILGGGVAGLTAAHELAERQFKVVLFERHDICGGKARSMAYEGSGTGGRPDWPAEHGFRFFPGFYWHLNHTMGRIFVDPLNTVTADQNLVAATEIAIAQEGKPLFRVNATHPETLQEWVGAIRKIVEAPSLGIPLSEGRVFVHKLFCFLGSGKARRLENYERTSWWEFIEADTKSDQYKAILAKGLSQSLVAMRPDKASALTVGAMLVQILLNLIEGKNADRVLNGPTNEAWIDPWVRQLSQLPNVTVFTGHTVTGINFDSGSNRILGVTVRDAAGVVTSHGDADDHYIAALPIDVVKTDSVLFPTVFKRAAGLSRPATGVDDGVDKLETEWMSGVLFYTNRDVSAAHGHVIYAHSPWALTSISQRQFWMATFPWVNRGNGTAVDILSTIISDWDAPANKVVLGKTAKECTRQEIIDETWAQLKAHLTMAGNGTITDGDRVDAFLDPAIQFDGTGTVSGNTEPLLVNTKGSRAHRPAAGTAVLNFFVASDYVATETDLACMEAANEAARHAVNALLQRAASSEPPCAIQPLQEPAIFKVFQDFDDIDYKQNPAQEPLLCRLVGQLVPGVAGAEPLNKPLLALLIMAGLNLLAAAAIVYILLQN